MQAQAPHSASAVWRAIIAGREALEVGVVQRVGDGSIINAWTDKCIPTTVSRSPIIKPAITSVERVSDLIDSSNWIWRRDLVRGTFATPDADAILNIPLRRGGGEDFLAWAHEKSGNYSVKSAYRALLNRNEQQALGEGSGTGTSVDQTHMWKALWSLKVVPKVRVFWWRVMRDILPDEKTLQYRHIRDVSLCKLCRAHEEDLEHALIHFSHARQFWDKARLVLDVKLQRLHPSSWAGDILCGSMFTTKERATIITIMWSIWSSRNRWTHDGEKFDPVSSIKLTREALALLDVPKQQAAMLSGHGWRPPELDQVKINTDAAVRFLEEKSGAGGVARSQTALMGAWCKPHLGVTDPMIAEALALRDGVIFANLRGYANVITDTDSLEIVILWNNRHNSRSVVAPVIYEIEELADSFHSFVIQHVSRSANGPAHLCVQRACNVSVTESWLCETPSFLVSSLLADCPANTFV
ncbi:Alanyl-tRNA synthetase [Hordeum vulgare]|nr:Alanyl-tRNA synthetase [Hordeum vulgare]